MCFCLFVSLFIFEILIINQKIFYLILSDNHVFANRVMEELTKLLTEIELTADDIIDTKHQIVNFDAKRHKTREALSRLQDLKSKSNNRNLKHWVCVGDMFIRLNSNESRNLIFDEQYHLDKGVEKLRDELKEKVEKLRILEGKPERGGFNLKPLDKKEILALKTAFKV